MYISSTIRGPSSWLPINYPNHSPLIWTKVKITFLMTIKAELTLISSWCMTSFTITLSKRDMSVTGLILVGNKFLIAWLAKSCQWALCYNGNWKSLASVKPTKIYSRKKKAKWRNDQLILINKKKNLNDNICKWAKPCVHWSSSTLSLGKSIADSQTSRYR